jgi:hypothetical protein
MFTNYIEGSAAVNATISLPLDALMDIVTDDEETAPTNGATVQPQANVQLIDRIEPAPRSSIDTVWHDAPPMPDAPTTINPRLVEFSRPTDDQESTLTSFFSENESSRQDAAESMVNHGNSAMQKLGVSNGGGNKEREVDEEGEEEREGDEEGEEGEDDDPERDETWSVKKKKPTSRHGNIDHIEEQAMSSKPSGNKKHGKSKAGKAKVKAKEMREEEKFPYAPDREPDISNVRIVYHVPDDSDDEAVSKIKLGKLSKTGITVDLPRISPMDEDFTYTYHASAKTVSCFYRFRIRILIQIHLYLAQDRLSSL